MEGNTHPPFKTHVGQFTLYLLYCKSMKQKKAYTYRFYPTDEQKHNLARTFGCVRFVYNWALREKTDAYYQRGERVSYAALSSTLTALKKQGQYVWLNEVSSVPTQQCLRHLERGFLNFFEGRAHFPTFKKKRNLQSAEYTTSAFMWRNGMLHPGGLSGAQRNPHPCQPARPLEHRLVAPLAQWMHSLDGDGQQR